MSIKWGFVVDRESMSGLLNLDAQTRHEILGRAFDRANDLVAARISLPKRVVKKLGVQGVKELEDRIVDLAIIADKRHSTKNEKNAERNKISRVNKKIMADHNGTAPRETIKAELVATRMIQRHPRKEFGGFEYTKIVCLLLQQSQVCPLDEIERVHSEWCDEWASEGGIGVPNLSTWLMMKRWQCRPQEEE